MIPSIPKGAAYVDQYSFVECYPIGKNDDGTDRFDLRRLLNEIQVVDPRLSLEELDRIEKPDPDIASLFDIADMQLSSRGADALCSFSLFKSRGPAERNKQIYGRTWRDYLEGLSHWIYAFRSYCPDQKIRVHVANDMWDELHKAGLLQSKDVDFIKMKHSDHGTLAGILWRYLALDDYEYEFVYAEDIDANGKLRDVSIERLRRDGPLSHYGHLLYKNSIEALRRRMSIGSKDCAHLSQIIAIRPNEFDYYPVVRLSEDQAVDSKSLFSDDDYNFSPELPFFIHSGQGTILCHDIATFCMSCGHWIARGSRKLPCSIITLLCRDFLRNPMLKVYNPEKHQWSYLSQFERVMQYYGPDDVFPFYSTRILDMKYLFLPNRVSAMREMYQFYGEDCFLLRFYKQLAEEGIYFSYLEKGDVLCDVPFSLEVIR